MAKVVLRLLEPTGALVPCPASFIGAGGIWTFPIGLQVYGEDRPGRVQALHVPDGVAIDNLGLSPPFFQLEGTFGTKDKVIRGRTLTPQEVISDLTAFVGFYFTERRQRIRERRDLIEMLLSDFVRNHHWIVQPSGAPKILQTANQPLRPYWIMTLQGVRRWQSVTAPPDPLAATLSPGSAAGVAEQLARFSAFRGGRNET